MMTAMFRFVANLEPSTFNPTRPRAKHTSYLLSIGYYAAQEAWHIVEAASLALEGARPGGTVRPIRRASSPRAARN
jgi:hypothetical protein